MFRKHKKNLDDRDLSPPDNIILNESHRDKKFIRRIHLLGHRKFQFYT